MAGSFASYAEEFLGRRLGFITGWTYWLTWVVTAMAEITAAGIYVQFWFPDIPQWVTALVIAVVLYGLNLVSVALFGEVEFWLALIKVVTVVAVIVIGQRGAGVPARPARRQRFGGQPVGPRRRSSRRASAARSSPCRS